VDFYAVYDDGTTAHLARKLTTKTLKPGDSEIFTIQWKAPPQNQGAVVKAIVDEQGVIGDCHPENNTALSVKVKCPPLG
jgi:hypothetical protein